MQGELGEVSSAEYVGACELGLKMEGYRVIFTACWQVADVDKACIMEFGEPSDAPNP
jgi:hypothetical protein